MKCKHQAVPCAAANCWSYVQGKGTKRRNIPAGRNYYYPEENTLDFHYKHKIGKQMLSVLNSKPTPRMDFMEQMSRCVTLKQMVQIFTTATSRAKLQL
jgi:hypothetical protein